MGVFDGVDYVALGHLHGRQPISERCATPARRWPTPSPRSTTQGLLAGRPRARRVRAEFVEARCRAGSRASRHAGRAARPTEQYATYEDHWLQVTLTDPARPAGAMDRLRRRFPHTLALAFEPEGGPVAGDRDRGRAGPRPIRARDRLRLRRRGARRARRRRHERDAAATRRSSAAVARRRAREAAPARRSPPSARSPAPRRSTSTRCPAPGCSCSTGRPARARPACSTRSASRCTAGCPAPATTPRTCAATTPPPDRAPEVVLEVTIRGRRFMITRSPAVGAARSSAATGTTEREGQGPAPGVAAAAPGTTWSTRFDEAGQLIGDLLGMSAEQFCQVVLLPQGDFAAFLRAGAEDRRAVLERLFATEVFAQVEGWLAERRRATGREADDLRVAAESVADRAAEAAGAARPDLEPCRAGRLGGRAARPCRRHGARPPPSPPARPRAAVTRHGPPPSVPGSVAARQERHADARRRSAAPRRACRRARGPRRPAARRRARRPGPAAAADAPPRARPRRRRSRPRSRGAATALRGLVPGDADADLMRKEERARRDELVELAQRREDGVPAGRRSPPSSAAPPTRPTTWRPGRRSWRCS